MGSSPPLVHPRVVVGLVVVDERGVVRVGVGSGCRPKVRPLPPLSMEV